MLCSGCSQPLPVDNKKYGFCGECWESVRIKHRVARPVADAWGLKQFGIRIPAPSSSTRELDLEIIPNARDVRTIVEVLFDRANDLLSAVENGEPFDEARLQRAWEGVLSPVVLLAEALEGRRDAVDADRIRHAREYKQAPTQIGRFGDVNEARCPAVAQTPRNAPGQDGTKILETDVQAPEILEAFDHLMILTYDPHKR